MTKIEMERKINQLMNELNRFVPEGEMEVAYISVKLGMFMAYGDIYLSQYYASPDTYFMINLRKARDAFQGLQRVIDASHNKERDLK